MELRITPTSPLAGPAATLPNLVTALPTPGATTGLPDGGHPGGPPGLAFGSANAILAGLNSPLAMAGLLSTAVNDAPVATQASPALAEFGAAAWQAVSPAAVHLMPMVQGTGDTPASLRFDAAPTTQPVDPQGHAEAPSAQPLTPAWVTALQTPATRLAPWPQPTNAGHQHRQGQQASDDEAADDDADSALPTTGAGPGFSAAPGQPPFPALAAHWPPELDALLPPEVRAELARRRSVLMVAPPGAGQRGLQLACLGFETRGEPVCHRWAVRGAAAATGHGPDWMLWRVRREGDDGQRPVLNARAVVPGQTAATGLVLRATATVAPAPLRPAGYAWLDVLEPQRLWRNLGSQWTVLLAWSPHPLPLQSTASSA